MEDEDEKLDKFMKKIREMDKKTVFPSIFGEVIKNMPTYTIIQCKETDKIQFLYTKNKTNADSCLLYVIVKQIPLKIIYYAKITHKYPKNELDILFELQKKYKDDRTIMTIYGYIKMKEIDKNHCCYSSKHFKNIKSPTIFHIMFLKPYGYETLAKIINSPKISIENVLKLAMFSLSKLQHENIVHFDIHLGNIVKDMVGKNKNFSVKIGNLGYDNIIASKKHLFMNFTLIDFSRAKIIKSEKDIPWDRFGQLYRHHLIDDPLLVDISSNLFQSSKIKKYEKKIENTFTVLLSKIKKNVKANFKRYSKYIYYIDFIALVNILMSVETSKKYIGILEKIYNILTEGLLHHIINSNPPPARRISEIYAEVFELKDKPKYKLSLYIVPS